MSIRHRTYILLLIFVCCVVCSVCAQPIKRLTSVSYNINQGLLQSHIKDLVEDGSGFIWISTGSSIQRFDGKSFRQFSLPANSKGAINDKLVKFFRLENGNILFAQNNDITEYNTNTHRFTPFAHFDNFDPVYEISVMAEEKNSIWCYKPDKGYLQIDKKDGKILNSLPLDTSTGVKDGIAVNFKSADQFIPVFSSGLLQIIEKATKRTRLYYATPGQKVFFSVVKINDDSLLVATLRGIETFDRRSGRFELICGYKTDPVSVNRIHPVQIRISRSGNVLVSEGKELFELDLHKRQYISRLVSLQNEAFPEVGYITAIREDRHNNIWILTENSGIYKINNNSAGFRYYGTADKKNNFVKTIYADKEDNRVLCGTFERGLFIYDTSQQFLHAVQQFQGTTSPVTVCGFQKLKSHQYLVFLMNSWNVYLLNTLDYSVRKINVNARFVDHQLRNHRYPDYHLTIYPLSDSLTIMQSGYHIYKLKWDAGTLSYYEPDSLPLPSISSMYSKHSGLWVGSYGKYFRLLNGYDRITEYTVPGESQVKSFCENGNGETWMGTEKGLYLLDKNGNIIRTLKQADGLPDETIYAIRKDNQNNLWLTHNKGLSCYKTDGNFLHFNKNDGLQENEFNTNTSFESENGELFFGGVNGISSFYPAAITSTKENPIILLTGIKVNNLLWKGDTSYWNIPEIRLPYNGNNLSFSLTAMGNRSSEQYNYQYQLSPVDGQWINAGNNPEVRYVLNPGTYKFRYYAGNEFDADPDNVKELLIVIKAPFWKTNLFIGLVLLLLAIATIVITRYISQRKLKRKLEELDRKRLVDEERLRISREMHDDIGAGLTQITLMSEAGKTAGKHEQSLNEIGETSRQLVSSMSEIIWSMNPGNNTLDRLMGYLREQISKLLEYSGINYQIDFPIDGKHIVLSNAQRRNILLITKEIVHNAIKHSAAKNILVQCKLQTDSLNFLITDDGKGFDHEKNFTGNGLRNIRRRVEELDGALTIRSSVDKGSSYSYRIPLS